MESFRYERGAECVSMVLFLWGIYKGLRRKRGASFFLSGLFRKKSMYVFFEKPVRVYPKTRTSFANATESILCGVVGFCI